MFKYIADILSQFSTPQKVIALSLILLSIVIITLGPSMIQSNDELKEEIVNKNAKIKTLEDELNKKDSTIRIEQKSCTNEILVREKEFIAMLDYLQNKAKKDNNKIISQTNMESIYVEKINDSLMYSPSPRSQSTIIVKNDMGNMITEIDKMRKKLKH
jgi:hypothetical protein